VANTKSALKSIKKSRRNYLQNKSHRSAVRTLFKKCVLSISNYSDESALDVQKQINYVYSKLDKAVKQGIYHKNKAARKKSALAKLLNEKTKV
jgi:small subunit ribosomal protein S20|tara:strand:+ start:275 stop:553 length:279 start_codon:yes stop_codon:yes gene_type:complete